MGTLTPGDVVTLWFPFSHSEDAPFKKRPVLVLSSVGAKGTRDETVLVAMITSSAARVAAPASFDIIVDGWEHSGLRAPSVVRANRIWTAENRDVASSLGRISAPTLHSVKERLAQLLGMTLA